MGDLLFFQPAFRAMKNAWPGARFDLLVTPNGARGLYEGRRLFEKIIEFPDMRWFSDGGGIRWPIIRRVVRELRATKYGLTVWPYADTTLKKLLLDMLIGAQYSFIHQGEGWFGSKPLSTRQFMIPFARNTHVVDRNLALVQSIGIAVQDACLQWESTAEEIAWGMRYLVDRSPEAKKRIGVHPGGNLLWCSTRQWPLTSYQQLIDRVSGDLGYSPVLFGTRSEVHVLEDLASRLQVKPLIVSDLPLNRVASVIKNLDLFVGNDSSLVHMAAAMGIPSLSIVGPTNPDRTGPRGEQAHLVKLDLACSPCFDDRFDQRCPHRLCLAALSPDSVFRVLQKVLDSAVRKNNGGTSIHQIPTPELASEAMVRRDTQDRLIRQRTWKGWLRTPDLHPSKSQVS